MTVAGRQRKLAGASVGPDDGHGLLGLKGRRNGLTADQATGIERFGLRRSRDLAEVVVAESSAVVASEQRERNRLAVFHGNRQAGKTGAGLTPILSQRVFGGGLREAGELIEQGAVGSTERAQVLGFIEVPKNGVLTGVARHIGVAAQITHGLIPAEMAKLPPRGVPRLITSYAGCWPSAVTVEYGAVTSAARAHSKRFFDFKMDLPFWFIRMSDAAQPWE